MSQVHTDESISGIDPGTEISVSDEKREAGLDYISKSRIKTYRQCPYKFYTKYWCGHRGPTNMAMERGSQIHLVFEQFHDNLMDHIEKGGHLPERFTSLMPEVGNETQWLDYIGNFWRFELRRLKEAERSLNCADCCLPGGLTNFDSRLLEAWTPLDVEAEFWMGEPPSDYDGDPDYIDSNGPPVGNAPWMGKADVILNSASVPGVTGSGVTILDYKTGSCPTTKYGNAPFVDDMLYDVKLETSFYGWIAEQEYDVDAVAIYYPKDDELVVGDYGVQERRFDIKKAVLAVQQTPGETGEHGVPENFDFEPQTLCHYGHGGCFVYNICPSAKGRE